MGTKSKDIDLLGQLFSNKDLMKRIMNGEVEEDEITNLLKVEDKTTPEYVVKEVLKDHLIKYFRERFYIYNNKIWEIQDDRQHIAVKKLINHILKQISINYTKLFVNDCVELLMSEVEGFKNETTRYSIFVLQNGTLYYDKGNYKFKASFDSNDEVRDDENPMFQYEFDEDIDDVSEIVKVFNEWGCDPEQLLEIIKYSLFQKGNPHNICFYLKGEGSNGKSQYLKLLEKLLPATCVTHLSPAKLSGDKDGSESLEKSYVNTVSEVRFIKYDMTVFKNILGNEPIQVNPKFKPPRTIHPTCKFILSSNEDIELRSTKEGDLRRFIQIPFENGFAINRTFFEERLEPYIPSLFAFCLKHSKSIWDKNQGLMLNKQYLDSTRERILGMSNTVYIFIEEFEIVSSSDPQDCRYVYRAYKKWIEDNGQRPLSAKNFWKEMASLVPGYKNVERKHYQYLSWAKSLNSAIIDAGGNINIGNQNKKED